MTYACAQWLSHVGLLAAPWTIASLLGSFLPMDFPGKYTGSAAISYFRGSSSWPRDQSVSLWVSCIGSMHFTTNATWEVWKVAINQDEKCSNGIDLGERTRNSPFVMWIWDVSDKQMEMSGRLLLISLGLEREGLKERWVQAGEGDSKNFQHHHKSSCYPGTRDVD